MSYVSCGAKVDGTDVPTKAALKRAISDNPDKVYLYGTSRYEQGGLPAHADKLPEGHKYSVTGPNPYNSRKWYATVERRNGRLSVK